MGNSQGTLIKINRLVRDGLLPPSARVLDFGSENLYGEIDLAVLREFVDHFSPDLSLTDAHLEALTRDHGKVADLFSPERYLALDMYEDPRSKVRKFDLNFDSLAEGENGTFDLVLNLGTTEHVANQFNCFKVIHDAVKPGGIMFNYVPFFGGCNHGLVKYEPKFFLTLIANNGYEALDWVFTQTYTDQDNPDRDRMMNIGLAEGGQAWDGKHLNFADMVVTFRKISQTPFAPPTDFVTFGDVAIGFPTVNEMLLKSPGFRHARVYQYLDRWRKNSARVVLYGAGRNALALAQSTRIMEGPIVGVVDSSPLVQGTAFLDFLVAGPESIPALRPDVILITSAYSADEIARGLQPYAAKGIDISRFF